MHCINWNISAIRGNHARNCEKPSWRPIFYAVVALLRHAYELIRGVTVQVVVAEATGRAARAAALRAMSPKPLFRAFSCNRTSPMRARA